MNQAVASCRRASMASAAGDAIGTVSVAYTSAPPRAAALTAAAVIDTRLGSREAAKYEANPSTMPNGNVAMPLAMISAFATVATASTVNGQRRSSAIGLQATPTRRNCGPCWCGFGPAVTASATSAVHTANTTLASHWRRLIAAGRVGRNGPPAG